MQILLIAVISVFLMLVVLCTYFTSISLHPRVFSHEEAYKMELNSGRITEEEIMSLSGEEIYISSPFGYELYGRFYYTANAEKAIVICHGITWNLIGSLKYVNLFISRGFNVLIYDHRNHGKSGGSDTTFGYYEKYDLQACIKWLKEKLGSNCKIGIHGESLGAATALQYCAMDNDIEFCIADSSYSNLYYLLKTHVNRNLHLPTFPLLHLCSLITKLRINTYYRKLSPIDMVSSIKTPIFFIHAQNDDFIPVEMSIQMFQAKIGAKKIYIAPNSGHVEAYWKNREEYSRHLDEFLMEIGVLQ